MSLNLALWLVTKDPALASRWVGLLAFAGKASLFARIKEVPATGFGLLVVDAASYPGPASDLARGRKAGLILLLTSSRPLPDKMVAAFLDTGYDDCIPASLDGRLIEAKIRAHLRRHAPSLGAIPAGAPRVKTTGPLTPTEKQLLELFLEWPGMVLTRDRLLVYLRGEKAEGMFPGTVDKHVESLRRKLGPRGPAIRTVYGTGYVLEVDQ
jgi:DNA-binding response OmpR family regulator